MGIRYRVSGVMAPNENVLILFYFISGKWVKTAAAKHLMASQPLKACTLYRIPYTRYLILYLQHLININIFLKT